MSDTAPRPVWPLELRADTPSGERVLLRPMRRSDEGAFIRVRRGNQVWLARWEATSPDRAGMGRPVPFKRIVKRTDAEARAGRMLPLVIDMDGVFAGQINVNNIVHGAFRSCTIGYWVAESFAGRGIAPTAVAMVGDHVMRRLALHRIEINIRPENTASLAVVRKLGFRDEGVRPRYLHIDGAWRDHRSFAVTTEDLAGSTLVARLSNTSQPSRSPH